MTERGDLSPLESSLDAMFRRLGLPDPLRLSRLMDEWDEIAGEPWRGRSRPVTVEGRVLVVEANTPSTVAFLRYGETALLEAIRAHFGDGFVDRVEVRPPSRR